MRLIFVNMAIAEGAWMLVFGYEGYSKKCPLDAEIWLEAGYGDLVPGDHSKLYADRLKAKGEVWTR